MVGYSRSNRHAASDRRIKNSLERHAALMQTFINRGHDRAEASALAASQMKADDAKAARSADSHTAPKGR